MSGEKRKTLFRCFLIAVITLGLIFITAKIMYSFGIIIPNDPKQYYIRGIDVSAEQGDIRWDILSKKIDFAFIKATDGAYDTDPKFADNYRLISGTGIRAGYYHTFRFESSGELQARNFISAVPENKDMLPPVISVQFYNHRGSNPPPRIDVENELSIMIGMLKDHYGMSPIIYASAYTYNLYISGAFDDCDIWIRDVLAEPSLSDGRDWVFWQYTEKLRIDGCESFVNSDVFYAALDKFNNYPPKERHYD